MESSKSLKLQRKTSDKFALKLKKKPELDSEKHKPTKVFTSTSKSRSLNIWFIDQLTCAPRDYKKNILQGGEGMSKWQFEMR